MQQHDALRDMCDARDTNSYGGAKKLIQRLKLKPEVRF